MLLGAGGALSPLACSLIVDTSNLSGGVEADASDLDRGNTMGDRRIESPSDDGPSDAAYDEQAITDGGGPDVDAPDTGLLVTTDLLPTKDAYVRDGTHANTNFGTATNLDIKVWLPDLDRNTWISFDIRGYSQIASAKLRLYVAYVGAEDAGAPANVYYAPTASDSWIETQLTWNNAPAPGNTPSGSIATVNIDVPNLNTWVEFDVTSSVAADTDGTATLLVSPWTAGTTKLVGFSSREGPNPPVLRIVH
jgi:hyaluronate lyase